MMPIDRPGSMVRKALKAVVPPVRRNIVCIGHSHLGCVQRAAAAQGAALTALNFWNLPDAFVGEPGSRRLDPAIAALLRGAIFSFVGGASHNVVGLVAHPEPFDFVLPAKPDLPLDDGARILPAAAVREAIRADLQAYYDIIDMIRLEAKGPVFHMQSPPPFGDSAAMVETIYWPNFPGRPHKVAPKYLRYKLWRLHSQMVREFCEARRIGFIAHPPEVTDAEGFLAKEYFHDSVHANAAYGALVIGQMRRAANRAGALLKEFARRAEDDGGLDKTV
jgi:hypothetical protein